MKNKLILLLLPALVSMGCLSYGDRHEAFIKKGNYYVGKTIQFYRNGAGKSEGIKQLANGNFEEEWKNNRPGCSFYYEYTAVTEIIVAFRFTGNKTNCISTS